MKTKTILRWILSFGLLANGTVLSSTEPDLVASFHQPPDAARPWVYWFWMDGNISPEGITADLEAMARVGIGGVILMEVDVGIPRGPVQFMSAPWRACFKHAVQEAERLGLEITLNAGPGWTGSGGPWVRPEESMQHLVAATVDIHGPLKFEGLLPKAKARPAYFGEAGLPDTLLKAKNDFYADVAVLAMPIKAGKAPIADLDEKALYLRHPYSSRPGTKPYLYEPTQASRSASANAIERGVIHDLTRLLTPEGRLNWDVPNGSWRILRLGRTSTGANTRPAPVPGLGLESDKFDRAALEAHFRAFIGALLEDIGPRPASRRSGWTMLHIDSWEMGAQNWTAEFRAEFMKRRGYDPLFYLPVVTGCVVDNAEITERFLWDWRITAQELVVENHAKHLKALAHQHGFGLSIEPYDMNPCADLTLGTVADVPMCEFWAAGHGFNTAFSCIEAVSIAHTTGRPVVAAEAFTAGDSEAWKLHPGAMKAQADWAFCAGINRLVIHRYAHQPWLDRVPGMTMGPYGTHYERTQTWWDLAKPWHLYLARCQFMLRRGLAVADICYLAPEGAPHVFRPPPSALDGTLLMPDRRPYNFDGCAPETLLESMSVRDNRLVLRGGTGYRVLVLPEMETMRPALLRKIRELVEAGATVIGPPPIKSPSLSGYPGCDEEVQDLSRGLWGAAAVAHRREHKNEPLIVDRQVGKGRVIWGPHFRRQPASGSPEDYVELYGNYPALADYLRRQRVPPDFTSDAPIRYAHRQDGPTEIYFLSNRENRPLTAQCQFRSGSYPARWDPVSGRIFKIDNVRRPNGVASFPVEFEPNGSVFIVFSLAPVSDLRDAESSPARLETVMDLTGRWEIEFQKGRGAPDRLVLEKLVSWPDHPEPTVKYFSGIATYRQTFDFRSDAKLNSEELAQLQLDLGSVQVVAQVTLNGHDLGVLWKPPFRVAIGGALKEGQNQLEIKVANLWPNRLIGDKVITDGAPVTRTTWNPFQTNSPLLQSGLIGPVVMVRLIR